MKVSLVSSMPKRAASAVEQINAHFAVVPDPLDAIHARKREIATALKAGTPPPDAFAQEAEMRGISPEEFADLVLSKPCPVDAADERELERQRLLLAAAAAKTPAAIDAVLAALS